MNLLTPREAALLLHVDPKTIGRWAESGRIDSIRTLGGHRRYPESDLRKLLTQRTPRAEISPHDF